jgi:hypothetical protein
LKNSFRPVLGVGKPVWVRWWSRPAAGGDSTRTMFVDITERLLMEQEQT